MTTVKTYPPVGECIYCGDRRSTLTREHIVPYGLGGKMVLPKASCRPCTDITHRFEQICLRMTLGPVRVRFGIQTRHPKQRPDRLGTELVLGNWSAQPIFLPIKDFPASVALPYYEPAGIGLGAQPTPLFPGGYWAWAIEDELKTFRRNFPHARGFRVGRFNNQAFSRMLAKIAHSYAIAEMGLGAFKPLLPDIIFWRTDTASYVIGGTGNPPPPAEPYLYKVSLVKDTKVPTGKTYTVVHIRLFSALGAPQYHVIVGER